MMQSEQIDELAAALAKAQAEITGARKSSENPYFKSQYADLAECWDAVREPLSKNGLCVIQTTTECDRGVRLITTLAHASGQFIQGSLVMVPDKSGPQAVGTCITYARRYALAAITGLAQVDDDGEGATEHSKKETRKEHHDTSRLVAAAKKGTDALKAQWVAETPALRKHVAEQMADWWQTLKTEAENADKNSQGDADGGIDEDGETPIDAGP